MQLTSVVRIWSVAGHHAYHGNSGSGITCSFYKLRGTPFCHSVYFLPHTHAQMDRCHENTNLWCAGKTIWFMLCSTCETTSLKLWPYDAIEMCAFYSASALLAMQSAVLARGIPSVCLSVTFRYCVQKNEDTIVRFAASGRTIPLVSEEVKFIRIFAGDHPQRGR